MTKARISFIISGMITEIEKKEITRLARKYKVGKIFLFGSAVQDDVRANDLDLGVDGILPEEFFRFYGELLFELDRPVDLIDLSQPGRFTDIIKAEGMCLYGHVAGKD